MYVAPTGETWSVVKDTPGDRDGFAIQAGGRVIITCHGALTVQENRANAQLVAKAKQYKEALEDIDAAFNAALAFPETDIRYIVDQALK